MIELVLDLQRLIDIILKLVIIIGTSPPGTTSGVWAGWQDEGNPKTGREETVTWRRRRSNKEYPSWREDDQTVNPSNSPLFRQINH